MTALAGTQWPAPSVRQDIREQPASPNHLIHEPWDTLVMFRPWVSPVGVRWVDLAFKRTFESLSTCSSRARRVLI